MRARVVATSVVAAAIVAGTLVACADLFHATDDILNECQLDAGGDACVSLEAAPPVDASTEETSEASIALCATTSTFASARAETACKWLGACETAMGTNQFATCMVSALEAYDCTIAPNRTPKGAARAFWLCMAAADSCAKVDACVYPTSHLGCSLDGGVGPVLTACDRNLATGAATYRSYCNGSASQPQGEPCFATGRTCIAGSGQTFCLGEGDGGVCSPGCYGTQLHDCDDAGVNVGVDCKAFGAQACVDTGGVLGCRAELGSQCTPSATITCSANNVATGCPSGVLESVACLPLTGQAHCDPSAPGATWDVSRACFSGLPCSPDSCSGATLTSCVAGATYTTSCAPPFTGCSTSPPSVDGPRARCTVPGGR